jgi:septal ring factor EnvC (AmiA/AmiB activator)
MLSRVALVVLVLAVCLSWPEAGDGQSDRASGSLAERIQRSSQKLDGLRQQIQTHRERVAEISDEEKDAEQTLQDLAKNIALVKDLLAGLDQREQILQQQSEQIKARLDRHQEDYGDRQRTLEQRLCALYRLGPQHNLQLILTAGSFSSLVARLRFATIVARLDARLMKETRDGGRQILDEQQELQAALAGIWQSREEAKEQRRQLESMEEERLAVLDELKREKQDNEHRLVVLKENEQDLSSILAELERQRQYQNAASDGGQPPAGRSPNPEAPDRDAAFAHLAGGLDWPVKGKVIRPFGRSVHPEFKTVTMNNGINIAAPVGAPVCAVASGKVEFADHLPGLGSCVILDHGAGYYSLYAQLDRIFVNRGDKVSIGEVLAEVGQAEAEGGPQLYFEIRQGKTPLDPMDWLKSPRP